MWIENTGLFLNFNYKNDFEINTGTFMQVLYAYMHKISWFFLFINKAFYMNSYLCRKTTVWHWSLTLYLNVATLTRVNTCVRVTTLSSQALRQFQSSWSAHSCPWNVCWVLCSAHARSPLCRESQQGFSASQTSTSAETFLGAHVLRFSLFPLSPILSRLHSFFL